MLVVGYAVITSLVGLELQPTCQGGIVRYTMRAWPEYFCFADQVETAQVAPPIARQQHVAHPAAPEQFLGGRILAGQKKAPGIAITVLAQVGPEVRGDGRSLRDPLEQVTKIPLGQHGSRGCSTPQP